MAGLIQRALAEFGIDGVYGHGLYRHQQIPGARRGQIQLDVFQGMDVINAARLIESDGFHDFSLLGCWCLYASVAKPLVIQIWHILKRRLCHSKVVTAVRPLAALVEQELK